MNPIIKDMVPPGTDWEVFETADAVSYSCQIGQLRITWHETYGRLDMRMGDAYMSVDFGEMHDPDVVVAGAKRMRHIISGMDDFLRRKK